MKLIALKANQASFHTVIFNSGLSVIVGRKESVESSKKKTYNSVGKSLIISLVHFCLGSNPNEEFKKKLLGWEFSLDFEIERVKFTSTRNTQEQEIIILNGERTNLKAFRKRLQSLLFQIEGEVSYLKFRPLISRFIRPKKSSYVSYDNFVNEEEDYPKLLNNAFLLGLDVDKVIKKYNLKAEYDNIDKSKKNIEHDSIIQNFFREGQEIDIDLVDLEDRAKKLSEKIDKFIIAEDFYQIKKEANDISSQLNFIRNRAILKINMLRNIEKSLEIKPDISNKRILDFYGNIRENFNELIVHKLDEVENFNKKLLANRYERLMEDKRKIEAQLEELEATIVRMGQERDQKMQYLNSRGALDEYTALNKQLSDYRLKLEKLQTYKKLLNQYKNELESKKVEFSQENIATNNYLDQAKPIIDKNILVFKSFTEQFYENKKAGIEVANNEGQNKQRFDISAKIQDDAGDGVNEVKIFCFDWTLLKAQHKHKVKMIFHDGRLLSDMDPRQRTTLFQIAYKNTIEDNMQYIISLNQDVLDSIREVMPEKEFEEIINKNIILELTDKSAESKLLGVQVDMDYEENKKEPNKTAQYD